MNISVVVCTHNPQLPILQRVLGGLRSQNLPMNEWELIVVDNASDVQLSESIDVSWHPSGRVVREDELGLTPARLRGISEATGQVVVFVDDDNLISLDFLQEVGAIAEKHGFLGAWGGSIQVEFERAPPLWVFNFRTHFAFREFSTPRWSNIKSDIQSQPYGAGMCLRREVCARYALNVSNDGLRRSLDRRGQNLLAGGDLDLVMTSDELGLGWGNFPQLKLTHLIPARRFEKQYMVDLRTNVTASNTVVSLLHGFYLPAQSAWRFWLRWLVIRLRDGQHAADFALAERRGQALGVQIWRSAR